MSVNAVQTAMKAPTNKMAVVVVHHQSGHRALTKPQLENISVLYARRAAMMTTVSNSCTGPDKYVDILRMLRVLTGQPENVTLAKRCDTIQKRWH